MAGGEHAGLARRGDPAVRHDLPVPPDVDLRLRDVWVGLVTAGLFSIGKLLIGLYLGTSGVASTYGAAGSWWCY